MPRERRERPKLCADVMLGRLAKWLRIVGFDVVYSNDADDDELVETCKSQGRILLTRDTAVAKRAGPDVKTIFVEGDHIKEQFASIRNKLPITLEPPLIFSRCLVCNTPLRRASREEVEPLVPAFVFNTNKEFKICPNCHKVYWKGTHVRHALRTVLVSFAGFNGEDMPADAPARDSR